jgi:hypothetical protein
MSIPNLGLSNPYLKLGVALMIIAFTMLVLASLFAVGSTHQDTTLHVGGVSLGSGIVVYLIGRAVKAWHSWQQRDA